MALWLLSSGVCGFGVCFFYSSKISSSNFFGLSNLADIHAGIFCSGLLGDFALISLDPFLLDFFFQISSSTSICSYYQSSTQLSSGFLDLQYALIFALSLTYALTTLTNPFFKSGLPFEIHYGRGYAFQILLAVESRPKVLKKSAVSWMSSSWYGLIFIDL